MCGNHVENSKVDFVQFVCNLNESMYNINIFVASFFIAGHDKAIHVIFKYVFLLSIIHTLLGNNINIIVLL